MFFKKRKPAQIFDPRLPTVCPCCGKSGRFGQLSVLWPSLVEEWELNPQEQAEVNLQQGFHCTACSNSLRAMVLARAIVTIYGGREPLSSFVRTGRAKKLRVLEINEAAFLGTFLKRLHGYRLVTYPETDICALPFRDESFDLVIHSDTLEHVADPVLALTECRRVLARGGVLAYTVPIVSGRLSRRRDALPPSFHGNVGTDSFDYRVHTEYGADAWTQLEAAGFEEIRIFSIAAPAARALAGIRGGT